MEDVDVLSSVDAPMKNIKLNLSMLNASTIIDNSNRNYMGKRKMWGNKDKKIDKDDESQPEFIVETVNQEDDKKDGKEDVYYKLKNLNTTGSNTSYYSKFSNISIGEPSWVKGQSL